MSLRSARDGSKLLERDRWSIFSQYYMQKDRWCDVYNIISDLLCKETVFVIKFALLAIGDALLVWVHPATFKCA
jgi:hypothetical protein